MKFAVSILTEKSRSIKLNSREKIVSSHVLENKKPTREFHREFFIKISKWSD